ncbi:MAG TPA: 4-alpha-glucanotransferase [Clostridia bacterium]|nr:4-alpha-glucanotransferase [Clostridia bacterium]
MAFDRSAGVLCNISSLPSKFGIGCFSRDAEFFASHISDMGFHWWQVLPITAIGYGNSPYSGISSYAGNFLYISPFELMDFGLVTEDEANSTKYHGDMFLVNYEYAIEKRKWLLNLAFLRITPEIQAQIDSFAKSESYWLEDYSVFMAIAEVCGKNWWEWESDLARHDEKAVAAAKKKYSDRVAYYKFEQFEFYREWFELKKKINNRGVGIIGDIPFYMAKDSVDIWANHEEFKLDENLCPIAIAGVPPDAFAANGQIWGNPLYDFEKMRKNKFSWWRKRVAHCLKIYDALRLDHFRAFYNYFSIPAEDTDTAVNGHWEMGAGMELVDLIKSDNKNAKIIVEDLGLLTEEVVEFVKKTELPNMKIFQFGFDGTPSSHLPHNYDLNSVAYTGTHDNNTTLGWLYDLNAEARNFALKYCGFTGSGWGSGGPDCLSVKAITKTVIASSSTLAVIPIQDLLGYGGDTRMNTPGVAEGNWRFRIPYDALLSIDRNYYFDLINTYGRNNGVFEKNI